MGRRAVRTVDPALDLSSYLKTIEELPRPWNSAAIFGREAPLEVEMGSGKGLFLETSVRNCPEHNFLGIEVATKYARLAASRLARQELHGGCMVHGDGLRIFSEILSDNSVTAVHVYFPDPWWKKRHRRRRVMNVPFIKDVQRVLIPGGLLHFWTDVEEYFQTTLELLASQSSLEGPLPVSETPAQHDLDYRTHFERRMRLNAEPIYRSAFKKPATDVHSENPA